jgi:hypothetical protein
MGARPDASQIRMLETAPSRVGYVEDFEERTTLRSFISALLCR